MQRFDQEPSRAKNQRALPWVGDPERWGGACDIVVPLDPAAGTAIVEGPQIIRGQTLDLCAVGWDLVGTWNVDGAFDAVTDSIQVAWIVTVGTGQATSRLIWDLGTIAPAGVVPNPQATALGWMPFDLQNRGGVALSGQPIIAVALAARPIVIASTAGVAHTLRVTCTGHCAPRGWVP